MRARVHKLWGRLVKMEPQLNCTSAYAVTEGHLLSLQLQQAHIMGARSRM